MKRIVFIAIMFSVLAACQNANPTSNDKIPVQGTWQLISSTTTKPDTTVIADLTNRKMIKIINATHFSFLNHDLQSGKDSATAWFVAGGGSYSLDGNQYHEHLEYCNFREWENHDFDFTVEIRNDTLIQKGVEKVEALGVEHFLEEKYVRLH